MRETDGVYEATTRGIRVLVEPLFLEGESSPDDGLFLWAYKIRIENHGLDTVQLLNRHWLIIDSTGRSQEVKGAGVVGEQPVLDPGEAFEYTSGAPLTTPSGIMRGTYEMTSGDGELFDVTIPAFSLDSPHEKLNLN